MSSQHATSYFAAGVDTERKEAALQRLVSRIRTTWPEHQGVGSVKLDIGFFANVIDIGGTGLAITTDGVGSKVLIAQMLNKYDTVGIDCVAMNVNDLLCVGATPLSMVDYLAVQEPDPDLLEGIAKGLCEGAIEAGISIPGGEIAQLREIVTGAREGAGFDLAGTAVGTVALDRIIVGQDITEGDSVIGLESNGIHSNGVTLARQVLLDQSGRSLWEQVPELGVTLGEELLRPTHIYVREVLDLLAKCDGVKALIHITSDGLLNLARVKSPTGYIIESLPTAPAIFQLIQEEGSVEPEEMFRVFNMGVGFCVVVTQAQTERALEVLRSHGKRAERIGHAVHDPEHKVVVEPAGLVGQGKRFWPAPPT